jgi:hypothetical protein
MAKEKRDPFDWALWFFWIMATTWGWIFGGFLFGGILLLASGVAIGILQWLVLKQRIRRDWQWIVATAIGWTAGVLIDFVLPPELDFFSGFLLGATTGMAQWLVLRREVHWAGWWIPISALGWSTGLDLLAPGLLAGVMPGALTGIALALLSRYPKPQEQPEGSSLDGRLP